MKQFGSYWEVVHVASGQVVNSGFTKGDESPAVEAPLRKTRDPGQFVLRSIPLFEAEQPARADSAETIAQAQGMTEVAIVDSTLPGDVGWGTPGGSTDPLPDGTTLYAFLPTRTAEASRTVQP